MSLSITVRGVGVEETQVAPTTNEDGSVSYKQFVTHGEAKASAGPAPTDTAAWYKNPWIVGGAVGGLALAGLVVWLTKG